MAGLNDAEISKRWLEAINRHDVTALAGLMATDFVFVDSLGSRVDGASQMEAGWRSYFAMCPDYWIRVEQSMVDGNTTLLIGEAGGTIDAQSWRTPAAWKLLIRDSGIAEWRVFADNKPVYDILATQQQTKGKTAERGDEH